MFELAEVEKSYPVGGGLWRRKRRLQALAGVDLSVEEGETLALVGESGCGKSTLARLLLRLEAPDRGAIHYRGRALSSLSGASLREFRQEVQLVFQDPYASLDPKLRIGPIVGEALEVRGGLSRQERRRRVSELLSAVGLPPEAASGYPHQFSGGQRQRIGIARALAAEPRLIVADEPVSALDVSVQAQVLNLLQDLKAERGLTYVFISHDLRVVRHVADRVAVLYLGRVVELAPVERLYAEPLHPYTRALLDAVPSPAPGVCHGGEVLPGDVPSPLSPPPGCPFHPRCPRAFEPCRRALPADRAPEPGRRVACYLWD